MPELRKDPIIGRWVIISTERSKRPSDLVMEKSQKLQSRIEQLVAMQRELLELASRCKGDEGPDCAILEGLASGQESAA